MDTNAVACVATLAPARRGPRLAPRVDFSFVFIRVHSCRRTPRRRPAIRVHPCPASASIRVQDL